MASEKTGKDLYLAFGDTPVSLSSDFRRFDTTESGDVVDLSAGADANRTYAFTLKDGTASFSGLYITGGSGTTVWNALALGTEGSLIWAEEGTASGKNYHYVNAIVTERTRSVPYDGVIEIGATWQFSGAVTEGTYA